MSTVTSLGSKALQLIESVAPMVATAFGGPFAGMAVSKVESVFGVTPGNLTDTTVLAATPDQLTALKKVDDDFQVQMKALGIQEEQLSYADVDSARKREEVVKDWTPRVIAIAVLLLAFTLEGAMLLGFHYPSQIAPELVGRILGTLDAAVIMVLSYYFGSSAGGRASVDTLGQIARQP